MIRFQMIRLNARALAAVVALLLLALTAAAGPTLVSAEDVHGDVVDTPDTVDTRYILAIRDAVDIGDAEVTGDAEGPGNARYGVDGVDGVDGVKSRDELLAEWDALNQERQRLMEELQSVHRDMQRVAGELWDHELEEARHRIREQLNEYGGDYGEEIVEWLPPRLIDHMADFTGRTPDQLRDMVREGAWGELF